MPRSSNAASWLIVLDRLPWSRTFVFLVLPPSHVSVAFSMATTRGCSAASCKFFDFVWDRDATTELIKLFYLLLCLAPRLPTWPAKSLLTLGPKRTMTSFNAHMGDYTTNQTKKGWLTSILELGAWTGTLYSGFLAELISRKYAILVNTCVFIIGVIVQCTAVQAGHSAILGGRFVVGMGVGSLSMIVPMYVAECAPPELRGLLISLQQFAIEFGIMVSFWIVRCSHDRLSRRLLTDRVRTMAPTILVARERPSRMLPGSSLSPSNSLLHSFSWSE